MCGCNGGAAQAVAPNFLPAESSNFRSMSKMANQSSGVYSVPDKTIDELVLDSFFKKDVVYIQYLGPSVGVLPSYGRGLFGKDRKHRELQDYGSVSKGQKIWIHRADLKYLTDRKWAIEVDPDEGKAKAKPEPVKADAKDDGKAEPAKADAPAGSKKDA